MAFNYSPTDGLRNTSIYPSNPASEAAAREQLQGLLDQAKDAINLVGNINLAANGYIKLNCGLILQWGSASKATGETITFNTSFSSTAEVYFIDPKPYNNTCKISFVTYTKDNFVVLHDAGSAITVFWFAIGK